MFVQNLNTSQQEILLSMAKQVISVDGIIDEREMNLFYVLKSQCNQDVKDEESINFEKARELFSTKASKVSLMLELIGVAHADEEYRREEQEFIKKVANSIQISENILCDLENWVKRQIILVKEANLFMEE